MRSGGYVGRALILGAALLFWVNGLPVAHARARLRPPPARAPADPRRAQANKLLKAGSGKLEIGLYTEALRLFEAAYRLVPSPKISYNIALAYNYMGRYVEALDNFERFVRGFADHTHKYWKAARNVWIPRLLRKIATVQVRVSVPGARVTVDGKDAGTSPRTRVVRVQPEPGRLFVIVVRRARYVSQTLEVKLRAGQRLVQKVRLVSEAEALAQRQEYRREQAERLRIQRRLERERLRARRERSRRYRRLRLAGWATLAVGAAAALVGVVTGGIALADKYYVEHAAEGRLFADLEARYDRGGLLREVAWAGIGSGLVLAATAGVLLWLGNRHRRTERAASAGSADRRVDLLPAVGPRKAGLTVRLRF